tara:strand:+ start:608 stop:1183 length:576 start_codon:yes stop_codon:yes gene_type:complete
MNLSARNSVPRSLKTMPTLSVPKGRMEELFVLSKKFGNKRIVRNIYEYTHGTREIWLRKYRYVINNGTTIGTSELWDFNMGVHTFTLYAKRRPVRSGLCANKAFSCSDRDWLKRSKMSENKNIIDFIAYATRIEVQLKNYLHLLKKINYPKFYRFLDDYELYACCEENNICINSLEQEEDRDYMIKKLLEL